MGRPSRTAPDLLARLLRDVDVPRGRGRPPHNLSIRDRLCAPSPEATASRTFLAILDTVLTIANAAFSYFFRRRMRPGLQTGGQRRLTSVVVATSLMLAAFCVAGRCQSAAPGQWRLQIPLGLDAYLPIPEENPLTPEKIALGRKLFFDRRLSRDGTTACATCHDPRRAFTDGQVLSTGVFGRKGSRNVPTLLNRAYGSAFFWDGRAPTLEVQALQPIQHRNEMDMTMDEVLLRLRRETSYGRLFRRAFSREANGEDLARALASYLRTILAGNAPVDRYLSGERGALSEQARRGLALFRGKANCAACHLGPNFTDEHFHNTGVAWRGGQWLDPGRFAVTGREADRGAFKTPTLREIALTAPYMHDGSIPALEQVIDFYDRGGNPNPHLDPELRSLHLTAEEKQDLAELLRNLSGTVGQAR